MTRIVQVPQQGNREVIREAGKRVQIKSADWENVAEARNNPVLRDGKRQREIRIQEGVFSFQEKFNRLEILNPDDEGTGNDVVLEVLGEGQLPDELVDQRRQYNAFAVEKRSLVQANATTTHSYHPSGVLVNERTNIVQALSFHGNTGFQIDEIELSQDNSDIITLLSSDDPTINDGSGVISTRAIQAQTQRPFPLALLHEGVLYVTLTDTSGADNPIDARLTGYAV